MRIDEFGAIPDGEISAKDRTRFMLVGFDLTIVTPYVEDMDQNSLMSKAAAVSSEVMIEAAASSGMTTGITVDSEI